jgi:ABC-type uncharacterized transport system permease subunit
MLSAIAAIALYLCAILFQVLQLRKHPALRITSLQLITAAAVALHGFACVQWVFTGKGLDFSLFPMTATIVFAINLIVLISSLRKPVHSLFLILFPLAIFTLAATLLIGSTGTVWGSVSTPIGIHILVSILSYSLMTIAAFQSLLLALQNWRLRHKHLGSFLQSIPPLQTMEALLFEVLWAGFGLLTLSLITGFLFFEDFFAQHLAHKTVFSLIAWVVFAILLWGRHVKGWRGNTAIRWTLIGFSAMVLAYWGSKFVIEIILMP